MVIPLSNPWPCSPMTRSRNETGTGSDAAKAVQSIPAYVEVADLFIALVPETWRNGGEGIDPRNLMVINGYKWDIHIGYVWMCGESRLKVDDVPINTGYIVMVNNGEYMMINGYFHGYLEVS